MKKTMKVKDIDRIAAMLQQIDSHFPVKMNYAISKNLKTFEAECDTAAKQRMKIIDAKALKDEAGNNVVEGNNYKFPDDATEKAVIKEINDIGELEIEVDIMTIPISVVEMCDSGKYDVPSSKDMKAIEFMIED